MKFSEIKNKKILSIDSSDCLGKIFALVIDKLSLKAEYLMIDAPLNYALVPFSNLVGINDCLTIMNIGSFIATDICQSDKCFVVDIGKFLYDLSGKSLGKIADIYISKYHNVNILTDADVCIKPSNLVSCGRDNVIIKSSNGHINKRFSSLKQVFANNAASFGHPNEIGNQFENFDINLTNVSLLPNKIYADIIENDFNNLIINNQSLITTEDVLPTEISNQSIFKSSDDNDDIAINDYSFLVGRKTFKPIFDITNSFNISEGSIIDNDMIKLARKFGKIVELTLSCRI